MKQPIIFEKIVHHMWRYSGSSIRVMQTADANARTATMDFLRFRGIDPKSVNIRTFREITRIHHNPETAEIIAMGVRVVVKVLPLGIGTSFLYKRAILKKALSDLIAKGDNGSAP